MHSLHARLLIVTIVILPISACGGDPSESDGSELCAHGDEALAELRALGTDSSVSLDGPAMESVNAALSSLEELAEVSTDPDVSEFAGSTRDALSGIVELASADPQGQGEGTRQQAMALQQQYSTSAQDLAERLNELCEAD